MVGKKGGSTRRNITANVDEAFAVALQKLAAQNNVSVSRLAGELMEAGYAEGGDVAATRLMGPLIERVLTSHFNALSDRLARLLVRSSLEAGAGRLLVRALIGAQAGSAVAAEADARAMQEAVKVLRNRASEIAGLSKELAALEAGRVVADGEGEAFVGSSSV